MVIRVRLTDKSVLHSIVSCLVSANVSANTITLLGLYSGSPVMS
ncbi:secreted protein [gut metagenome]|uniref:Secreted protein n=1 Tax=gut metagenome TaxID=749906 RepID=J9G622_9ZZZZ